MLALLQNEYIKLFAQKRFTITCILFFILEALPLEITQKHFNEINDNAIIPVWVFYMCIYNLASNMLLADEIKTKTLNLIATRPFTRRKILMSKYIAILSITILYILLTSLVKLSLDYPVDEIIFMFWFNILIILVGIFPISFLIFYVFHWRKYFK